MNKLSHLDDSGAARMVDVGEKPSVRREAIASAVIRIKAETLRAIADGNVPKGDVLAVARIAGISAAKKCGELIPLCHPLALESVEVDFDLPQLEADSTGHVDLLIKSICKVTGKTGVEMEALTAVSIAALTIYDMCKAMDKTMTVGPIKLVGKKKN